MTPETILTAVSDASGVPVTTIKSRDRSRTAARARHVAMWAMREYLDMSYPKIAEVFGHSDSSARDRTLQVRREMRVDPALDRLTARVRARIRRMGTAA